MELLKKELHSQLLKSYPSCALDDSAKNDELILRLTVQDIGKVEDFKKSLSKITKTHWITKWENSDPKKYIFWKRWVCQHNQRNKVTNSKRNVKCEACLRIVIKKVTRNSKQRDAFLKRSPPLQAKVTLSLQHTHSIGTTESLQMLRVSDEVKKNFNDYFSWGMTSAEARMYHENKFLLDSNYEDMTNSSLNPTKRQASYLHSCWRVKNSDICLNPLDRLKERIPFYELSGSTIKIHEDNDAWAVLLVSPFMKRTQSLDSSREVIYIDSACGLEKSSSTLTVLYTTTKAGAMPIAVLIHKCQTDVGYFNAFMLLRGHFPDCFGGENFPAIFITEDLPAEKTALASVWPKSMQLLGQYYVAQTEWCWLFTRDSKVEKDEIPRLMKLFQNVMYATTAENLLEALCHLLSENQYPELLSRFNSFYQRRNEWVLLDRSLATNNDTNNFTEFTIRIIKDILICRTKAFNVVALIEFCLDAWEKFLTKRLLEFARSSDSSLIFKSIHEKMNEIQEQDVQECASNVFVLKRAYKSYTANTEVGVCNCPTAKFGAFCKHLYYLQTVNKISLPTAATISKEDKSLLLHLDLGEKCPTDSHVYKQTLNCKIKTSQYTESEILGLPLPEDLGSSPDNVESSPGDGESLTEDEEHLPEEGGSQNNNNNQPMEFCDSQMNNINENIEMASEEQKRELISELNRIRNLILESNLTKIEANKIIKALKKIKSVDDLIKFFSQK